MLFPALVLASWLADCVPMRWISAEPQSLELVAGSPVNCLVVGKEHWNAALIAEGRRRGLKMLATEPAEGADAVIAVKPRRDLTPGAGVLATGEAVWAGIRTEEEYVSGPTAAPWVSTNLGFVRYLRSRTREPIWLAHRPPEGQQYRRYALAVADAALGGARWILSLEPDYASRLRAKDARAQAAWTELTNAAAFAASLPSNAEPYSRLGVAISERTGALVSGGILDMIGSQHIPFRVKPDAQGVDQFLDFGRPEGWEFPASSLGETAIRPKDIAKLEPLHKKVGETVGRTNFGVRVFNASSVLSAPYAVEGGVTVVMVNYTDYPIEGVTLHVRGAWKKALLLTPGGGARELVTYPAKDATAVEIESLPQFSAVRVE